jgi:hypothetical protein
MLADSSRTSREGEKGDRPGSGMGKKEKLAWLARLKIDCRAVTLFGALFL